ncbi:Pentatricopeptide repeat-containing protein [Apostasia shenzhenica]|uniref:Pentatricopeptide repeat-containing protein n=1 Tax=Apostasia shenzhenica TaxID=1088818 RepID=A0A2I0B414_9ASPA|nr:Pentatricopeptide repeat-containing protein [Apostasia shenzhenica]
MFTVRFKKSDPLTDPLTDPKIHYHVSRPNPPHVTMDPTAPARYSSRHCLPWLLGSSRRPELKRIAGAAASRRIGGRSVVSNASIVRAIKNPDSSPQQILSLFSAAVRNRGFRLNIRTYASLLPFLVFHRRLRAAELIVRQVPLSGPSILLPIASSAISAGIPASATARLLLSASPSDSAFSSLLRHVLQLGQVNLARSLLLFACPADLGFQLRVRHFAGVVREYCRRGMVEEAEELVAKMGQKGVAADCEIYNTMLTEICDRCCVDDGIGVLREMEEMGISPDVITFSTLMGRIGMEGRILGCNALFGRMLVMGISPDWPCYRILFAVYCRNRLLSDALRVLRVMKLDEFFEDWEADERMFLECGVEFEEIVLEIVLKRGFLGGFIG